MMEKSEAQLQAEEQAQAQAAAERAEAKLMENPTQDRAGQWFWKGERYPKPS